jgi:hypothetical protein
VVNAAGLVILLIVSAVGADEETSEPFTVTVIAASATKEGLAMAQKSSEYGGLVKSMVAQDDKKKDKRHFDPELKGIEQAVADLPYDTYRKVNVITEKVKMNEDAEFVIDPTYTLHVTPVEKDDQNRVKLDLRIDEKVEEEDPATHEKKVVVQKALAMTGFIVPGKTLRLGGLKLKEGRLVIVLTVEPTP